MAPEFLRECAILLGLGGSALVGLMLNLLRRRNAQVATLRATLESSADGFQVTDLLGEVLRYTRKFADMAHLPKEVLLPRQHRALLHSGFKQVKNPRTVLRALRKSLAEPTLWSDFLIEFVEGSILECHTQPLWFPQTPFRWRGNLTFGPHRWMKPLEMSWLGSLSATSREIRTSWSILNAVMAGLSPRSGARTAHPSPSGKRRDLRRRAARSGDGDHRVVGWK